MGNLPERGSSIVIPYQGPEQSIVRALNSIRIQLRQPLGLVPAWAGLCRAGSTPSSCLWAELQSIGGPRPREGSVSYRPRTLHEIRDAAQPGAFDKAKRAVLRIDIGSSRGAASRGLVKPSDPCPLGLSEDGRQLTCAMSFIVVQCSYVLGA